jgi:hypothetical protein
MNIFRYSALVTCIHGNDLSWTDRVNLHVGSRILMVDAAVSLFLSIATFLIGRFSRLVCLRCVGIGAAPIVVSSIATTTAIPLVMLLWRIMTIAIPSSVHDGSIVSSVAFHHFVGVFEKIVRNVRKRVVMTTKMTLQ